MAEVAALIVAAGRGTRAGRGLPKQYRDISGISVLQRTIAAFVNNDVTDWIQVVIHPDDRDLYAVIETTIDDGRLLPPALGGETRSQSVRHGLMALREYAPKKVLIHDGARPFVSQRVIDDVVQALDTHKAACPTLPLVDALWTTDFKPTDRSTFQRAQTPQGFDFETIINLYVGDMDDAVDDISLAVASEIPVIATKGDEANFKVTTKDDFSRAEQMTRMRFDVRTGTGYDVHAFTTGSKVILNGITIAHDRALKGHSDADVAMHAITDAIYGALAEGDIGQWFPPSDPQWKGAASDIFLKHAIDRCDARDMAISHIDCTIVCEMPKIGPHALSMRENLSRITGIEMDRISVKATTSEKLGFTGRGEGIATIATATLVPK